MDKYILDLIHIVSLVYGGSDVFDKGFVIHAKALKVNGIYRPVPFFIGRIHTLRYGYKRYERALFRTHMNVILICEYVEL